MIWVEYTVWTFYTNHFVPCETGHADDWLLVEYQDEDNIKLHNAGFCYFSQHSACGQHFVK
jgi:hypothetical protein